MNLAETDHFIANNAYVCVEFNGHVLINIVYNIIQGLFPPERLRIWMTGSQSCEQLFFNSSIYDPYILHNSPLHSQRCP